MIRSAALSFLFLALPGLARDELQDPFEGEYVLSSPDRTETEVRISIRPLAVVLERHGDSVLPREGSTYALVRTQTGRGESRTWSASGGDWKATMRGGLLEVAFPPAGPDGLSDKLSPFARDEEGPAFSGAYVFHPDGRIQGRFTTHRGQGQKGELLREAGARRGSAWDLPHEELFARALRHHERGEWPLARSGFVEYLRRAPLSAPDRLRAELGAMAARFWLEPAPEAAARPAKEALDGLEARGAEEGLPLPVGFPLPRGPHVPPARLEARGAEEGLPLPVGFPLPRGPHVPPAQLETRGAEERPLVRPVALEHEVPEALIARGSDHYLRGEFAPAQAALARYLSIAPADDIDRDVAERALASIPYEVLRAGLVAPAIERGPRILEARLGR